MEICSVAGCGKEAAVSYEWPDHGAIAACADHAGKIAEMAAKIGADLNLKPVAKAAGNPEGGVDDGE